MKQRRCWGSTFVRPRERMSPSTYTLVVSAVALYLSQERTHAFVQLRPVSRRKQPACSDKITSMSNLSPNQDRRTFVSKLISTAAFGAAATSFTVEQAEAYEQEYLKEPTAEFKAMEARQTEFAAAQRAYKQDFVKKLDAFLTASSDEAAIASLNAMSNAVIQRGGLPQSVRINDLLKTCRRKKAEMKDSGQWGTPVQIAYEILVQTTNKTVVPLQSGS